MARSASGTTDLAPRCRLVRNGWTRRTCRNPTPSNPEKLFEAIRVNNGSRCQVLLQECEEGCAPEIRHDSHPGTSAPAPNFLHRHQHQGGFTTLELPTPSQSGLCSPNPSIIHLYFASKRFAFSVDHRPTQFVEHHPCRLITRESELVLQQKRRDATFICGHQVSRPKPTRQRDFRVMQNRSRGHRNLIPTPGTLPSPSRRRFRFIGSSVATAWADKSLWPPASCQIFLATLFTAKLHLEFAQIPGKDRAWHVSTLLLVSC